MLELDEIVVCCEFKCNFCKSEMLNEDTAFVKKCHHYFCLKCTDLKLEIFQFSNENGEETFFFCPKCKDKWSVSVGLMKVPHKQKKNPRLK